MKKSELPVDYGLWYAVQGVELYFGAVPDDTEVYDSKSPQETILIYPNGDKYIYYERANILRFVKPIVKDSDGFIPKDIWLEEFSETLKCKCKNQYYNHRMVADAAGISEAQLSGYLKGKVMPSGMIIQRLAEALYCPIEDLIPN